jgi:hypothetical protein
MSNVSDFERNEGRYWRAVLKGGGVYPTADLSLDPGYEFYEATIRAELPELLSRMDRTTLVAVYRLIRFLDVVPHS